MNTAARFEASNMIPEGTMVWLRKPQGTIEVERKMMLCATMDGWRTWKWLTDANAPAYPVESDMAAWVERRVMGQSYAKFMGWELEKMQ